QRALRGASLVLGSEAAASAECGGSSSYGDGPLGAYYTSAPSSALAADSVPSQVQGQLWNIDKLLTVAVPHWLAHSAGRGKFCDNMVKCKILQKWLQLQKQHRIPGALVLGQSVTGVCYAISIRVKRPSSMSSLLGKMGAKKQKMSTLEKSKLDWESFKEEEGIGEELAIHNRGKEGYLERKAFLERVDHRQFEIERDIRLSKMKP
uniref:Craniofacial development protein 1 n=1 Tax=Sphenodon punctatus TaxID=8508 RepID=A0A8D0GW20_SPHPU